MKRLAILMIASMVMVLVSTVRADENGDEKKGRSLFFHKCDESSMGISSPCKAIVAKMGSVIAYDDDDDNDDGDDDSGDYGDGDGDDDGGDD